MSEPVTFTLPWCPSVNRMWRTPHSGPLAGRTMLSREGRDYRKSCANAVLAQRVAPHVLLGKLAVHIIACPPDRRRFDLDNRLKACLDGIQNCGVIADDADIDDLHIVRGPIVRGRGGLHIEIRELPVLTATRELFEGQAA
jgi:crossover junction endodeoxyribonuclease RusA